jgi:hypothetical protein
MYGLVNRAIEQLVVSMQGESGWRGVCAHAGMAADGFMSMQGYDDDITYRLVAAVSKRLNLPADQVLEAFGEYWIRYTADEGYGSMMKAGGSTLREFLGNLNEMHGRVETVFPHMRLPLFRVEDIDDRSYRLYYASERAGLAPMVTGLVKGLAKRFDQTVDIEHAHAKVAIDEEDVFVIRELLN